MSLIKKQKVSDIEYIEEITRRATLTCSCGCYIELEGSPKIINKQLDKFHKMHEVCQLNKLNEVAAKMAKEKK